MGFPVFTIKQLADFTNQDEEYYTAFANTTNTQATLLFRIATCLSDMPEDPMMVDLASNAILAMSQSLYEGDKHTEVKFSPFQSETIGSYSYSIALTRIKNGEDTGVMWFDLAVANLGTCDLIGVNGVFSSGGVEVFEHDGTFVPGNHPGNERLLSPNDIGDFPNFSLDGN